MDYINALHRLLSLVDHERIVSPTRERVRYDLGRMQTLLARLGNPQLGLPTVHIAGTKGKGSTAAMCASVLSHQGYRTGLFSSPHLHTFRERISLDGVPISEDLFAESVKEVWPEVEWVSLNGGSGEVTMFEALTAMAFCCFRKRADFQVLEVGLGGRLDTTNLSSPRVCVITSLSLDHTDVLGDTIESIAAEKAGIIKQGVPVVTSPQQPGAMAVIESLSNDREAELIKVGEDLGWKKTGSSPNGQRAEVRGRLGKYDLWTPLLGSHQLENLTVALGALEVLMEQGNEISTRALEEGIREVRWPCRMEVLDRSPLIVCDGAHNPHSVATLCDNLSEYYDFSEVVLIVGTSQDKDLAGMVESLASFLHSNRLKARLGRPAQDEEPLIIATRSRHPRAADPGAIVEAFRACDLKALAVGDMAKAIEMARDRARGSEPETLVLVTGSLFIAAEAREVVHGIEPELYPELPDAGAVSATIPTAETTRL